jgi:hypothetical protein
VKKTRKINYLPKTCHAILFLQCLHTPNEQPFSPFFVCSSVESQNQPIYYQKAFDKGKRNFLILLRKCKLTKLGLITNNVVKYSPSILNKVSNNNLPNLFCRKLLKSHLTMLRRDFFEIGANFENYYKSQNKNH